MITRAHKYLFFAMLLACVVMAAYLIRMRNRAQDRLREQAAEAPAAIAESAGNPAKTVTLYVPNDLDDSLIAVERSIPLPAEENAQARVLLVDLLLTSGDRAAARADAGAAAEPDRGLSRTRFDAPDQRVYGRERCLFSGDAAGEGSG